MSYGDYSGGPDNQSIERLYLSPPALIYLFPELFSPKPLLFFGGFKSPCNNVKARYIELLISMIVGTLAPMFSKGIINFYTFQKGFFIKALRIGVIKLQDFDPDKYGYFSRRISEIPVGQSISVIDTIVENVRLYRPEKYLINKVFQNDLRGKGLFWNDKPENPICNRILTYRNYAHRLSSLIKSFAYYRYNEYKMIVNDTIFALTIMKPEIESED